MSRKMKDSRVEWIGEIPEKGWQINKIKSLFEIGRGRVISKEELDENNKYPVYSSQTKNNGILGYINTYDFEEKLLTWTTDGANAGTVFIRTGKFNCTNVCGTLRLTNKSEFDILFLYYTLYIGAPNYKRRDTNGYKIMNNEMAEIKIPLPNFNTQKKISSFINIKNKHVEELILNTKQSIEELKKYKQSLITEVVTKGLDKNVEMKNSGIEWIGEIPKDWEVKKLKFICVESKEYLSNKEDKDLEFNYIDIGSVSYDKGIIKNEKLKFINAPSRARKIINNEDVIISSVRTYLKAITVIENLSEFTVASTGFIVLKTTNNTNYEYLSYLLKSNFFTSKVQSLSEGITYPAIVTSKLMNIKVPIPALNEQIKLKNYLNLRTEKIDLLIEKKMNLIKEYESYKKSLIYEYVTGKKEVGEEVE